GARLVYSRADKAGSVDGVYVMETGTGAVTTLLTGKARYEQLAVDESGRQVAFLSDVDEFAAKQPSWKLYHWDGRAAQARVIATPASSGVPAGSWIPDNADVRFSPDGTRLFFGTAPRPALDADSAAADDDEEVVVDIWNWKDPLLQPMQLSQLDDERRRTYDAVVHLRDGRIVQLERPEIPNVTVAMRGDGD